ncbi:hypothetical protein [Streptomyces vinaceus]|uniref:hypothetical protein n=1 Tax=Streptomyces vinaceus TaxID=1960 RepID=UPI0037F77993
MPKNETSVTKDAKTDKPSPAGAFAGVRRRGAQGDRAAQAAALLGHAENVADASFLGTGNAVPPAVALSATPKVSAEVPAAPASPAVEAPQTPEVGEVPAAPTPMVVEEPPASTPAVDANAVSHAATPLLAGALVHSPADGATSLDPAPVPPLQQPSPFPVPSPTESSSGHSITAGVHGSQEVPASGAPAQDPAAPRRKKPKLLPIQQAIFDSHLDSKINSRYWDSHGVNLIPALWPALRERIARDRKSSGMSGLGLGHYIDVALKMAKMDTEHLIGLHDALNAERMGDLPKGRKTTLSLSPAARANAEQLLELLEAADFARKGKDVMSALVLNLLRALEREGPLPKPELPPLI